MCVRVHAVRARERGLGLRISTRPPPGRQALTPIQGVVLVVQLSRTVTLTVDLAFSPDLRVQPSLGDAFQGMGPLCPASSPFLP